MLGAAGAALALGLVIGVIAANSMPPAQPTPPPVAAASPSPSPTPVQTPVPAPTPTPTPTPEPTPVLVPGPLTGLPVSPAVAKRHPIAVMIDDLGPARPQSGLSRASIVWHAPAEGGIPRYMALFQSRYPEQVGPIRSSRLYYVAWAAEWRSVYIHGGGSPQAMALLNSPKGRGKVVYNADWSPFLYRVDFRYSPHNLYTDAAGVRKTVRRTGAKPVEGQKPKWRFAADAPLDQRPKGGRILVPYLFNKVTYDYDRKTNTYRRSVSTEGKQFDVSLKPKVRVAPKNVIVMQVRFVPIGDKKHRLDGQVTGSGTAWIATNGRTIKGTWSKKSFSAPTRFFDADGRAVTLTMGQTFVQVVPSGTRITVKDGKVPAPAASATPTPSPTPTP